jgi:hypothetical protein
MASTLFVVGAEVLIERWKTLLALMDKTPSDHVKRLATILSGRPEVFIDATLEVGNMCANSAPQHILQTCINETLRVETGVENTLIPKCVIGGIFDGEFWNNEFMEPIHNRHLCRDYHRLARFCHEWPRIRVHWIDLKGTLAIHLSVERESCTASDMWCKAESSNVPSSLGQGILSVQYAIW